jgi:hypothetical protein
MREGGGVDVGGLRTHRLGREHSESSRGRGMGSSVWIRHIRQRNFLALHIQNTLTHINTLPTSNHSFYSYKKRHEDRGERERERERDNLRRCVYLWVCGRWTFGHVVLATRHRLVFIPSPTLTRHGTI